MESIEKLRTAARNMAKGRNLEHHEECNLLLRIADEIEAEIAERYMELPTDADGVPIHVGDECWDRDTAERFEVSSIEWNGVCWSAWSVPETRHIANKVLHHRPRTLEVVLEDMLIEKDETDLCSMGLIAKYAAEIRELLGVSE